MSFLKGFDKIVSKDDLRPILQNVLFKNGFAVATDGHKLVKVDLKLYGLSEDDINNIEGCLLDLEVLNEIKLKKGQTIAFSKNKIEVNSQGRVKPLKTIELIKEQEFGANFVNYEPLLGKKEEKIFSISINAKFLLEIENVYNNLPSTEINKRELLAMVFCGDNQAVRLQNCNGSFEALLMPRKMYGYKYLSK